MVCLQFDKGAVHLVRTHTGSGGGGGGQVSYAFPLRITYKEGGGGLNSMSNCICTKWKAPKAHLHQSYHKTKMS